MQLFLPLYYFILIYIYRCILFCIRGAAQLFIDRFKFRGINVKHRVGEVKALVNAYSWEVRRTHAQTHTHTHKHTNTNIHTHW